jgi:hypothetical protein
MEQANSKTPPEGRKQGSNPNSDKLGLNSFRKQNY